MIQINQQNPPEKSSIKAVGLISGGLDSTLAAKIVKDLGIDVYGVYFSMPWGCCDKTHAMEAAQNIGIKFITLQLDERYLEIVKKPKHGYGRALNPCVDCRIHMFSRAAQYMKHIGAQFVFTGEVLGQRNMSQRANSMRWVEEGSGLKGRLLRPLSALHLDPTIPETEGLIDRDKLLDLTGRSRQGQLQLAKTYAITSFSAPAGGCLLTDENFAVRMKDTLKHGYRNFRETIALKWGRHFRLNENFKFILGRDEEENLSLIRYAHHDDIVMQLEDNLGPTLVIKGNNPTSEVLALGAGLIQKFSKYKDDAPKLIVYWKASDKNFIQTILAAPVDDAWVEEFKI